MKKSLLLLAVTLMAWIMPAYAFGPQEGMYAITPYPPVVSTPIADLPEGFDTILLGNETFYYCDGAFFQKIIRDNQYAQVPAPIGAVIFNLPVGYQYVQIDGDNAIYVYKGVYYKKTLYGYRVIPVPAGI